MTKYKVELRGENFHMIFDDEPSRVGFYVTRYVEAEDPEKAEFAAVELLRHDAKLTDSVWNPADDPPMIHLEEINPLEDDFSFPVPPGFAFFPEEPS